MGNVSLAILHGATVEALAIIVRNDTARCNSVGYTLQFLTLGCVSLTLGGVSVHSAVYRTLGGVLPKVRVL